MRAAPAVTLAATLQRNAQYFRNEIAWSFDGRTLTHGAFLQRATWLAAALQARGVEPRDRVAVLCRNGLEICEVYAAGELAGTITATVNFRFAAPEIGYVLRDSAPKAVVFEREFADSIGAMRNSLESVEHFICVGGSLPWAEDYDSVVASGDPAPLLVEPTEADTAYLIYTSGTTGRPKGCMLGQHASARTAEIINGVMRAGQADRLLLMMPLFHIGAKAMQLGQHWRGGRVVLHREFNPEAILRTIQDERITITHMAPTMIQALLDHPGIGNFDLSSLRLIVYSAAPMPNALLRRGLDLLGPVFLQMYGQTEGTGTMLTIEDHQPDGDERDRRRLKSIGIPFSAVQARVVDEAGADCPADQPGEILLGGPTLMQGYWNNSVATAATVRKGWLYTGDVGTLDDDGYLYLVDRKKDMIVSGGENIYSREVEEALYQHAAVANAAVIGVPDAKWGEAVCAVVELREGAVVTEAELVAHCRTLIASYKRPQRVIFVDELPKLASGKINKLEIRQTHGRAT